MYLYVPRHLLSGPSDLCSATIRVYRFLISLLQSLYVFIILSLLSGPSAGFAPSPHGYWSLTGSIYTDVILGHYFAARMCSPDPYKYLKHFEQDLSLFHPPTCYGIYALLTHNYYSFVLLGSITFPTVALSQCVPSSQSSDNYLFFVVGCCGTSNLSLCPSTFQNSRDWISFSFLYYSWYFYIFLFFFFELRRLFQFTRFAFLPHLYPGISVIIKWYSILKSVGFPIREFCGSNDLFFHLFFFFANSSLQTFRQAYYVLSFACESPSWLSTICHLVSSVESYNFIHALFHFKVSN